MTPYVLKGISMSDKPLVILQNNLVTRVTGAAAIATRKLGIDLYDISSGDMTDISPLPPGGPWSPVLIMGSVLFVQQWAQKNPALSQWIFWDDAKFDAALWKDELGSHYLNADGHASTIGEFIKSDHGSMHIRPRSGVKLVGDGVRDENHTGQKSISGLVVTPSELVVYNIDETIPIWVSPVKNILAEIRLWWIGSDVVAASTYRQDGEPHFTNSGKIIDDAKWVAEKLRRVWYPDHHYVIDLALCEDGVFRVIEYNPIHSSGWYAVDPQDVIKAYIATEGGVIL